MTILFALCAAIGGTVVVCQFLLTVLGLTEVDDLPDDVPSDPHDIDVSADALEPHAAGHGDFSSWLFSVLTFRTVTAALAFFGLVGLAGDSAGLTPPLTFAAAIGAGAGAMWIVHKLMQVLARLRADGTVRIDRAVGQPGKVYLRIPGAGGGMGKVMVQVQNRSLELNALSVGDALPTGATVTVVRVVNSDTVEVAAESIPGVQHA